MIWNKILETNSEEHVDEEMINEIVKEWDYNGDGKIDYSEFYRWMSTKMPTFLG